MVIEILLGIIILVLAFLYWQQRQELEELKALHADLDHNFRSKVVTHGKNWEVFAPFMEEFQKHATKENFRFLGNPIDGVVFEEDKIIFAEFKASGSQLSSKQKRIKDLVEQKKVEWYEHRVK